MPVFVMWDNISLLILFASTWWLITYIKNFYVHFYYLEFFFKEISVILFLPFIDGTLRYFIEQLLLLNRVFDLPLIDEERFNIINILGKWSFGNFISQSIAFVHSLIINCHKHHFCNAKLHSTQLLRFWIFSEMFTFKGVCYEEIHQNLCIRQSFEVENCYETLKLTCILNLIKDHPSCLFKVV